MTINETKTKIAAHGNRHGANSPAPLTCDEALDIIDRLMDAESELRSALRHRPSVVSTDRQHL